VIINRVPYPVNQDDIYLIYPDNVIALNFASSLSDLMDQIEPVIRDVILQNVVKNTIKQYESGMSVYEIAFLIQATTYKLKSLRDDLDNIQYGLIDSED
jgi:hypothetical protein